MVNGIGPPSDSDGDASLTAQEPTPQYPILETLRLCFLRLVFASSIVTMSFAFYGVLWARELQPGIVKWTVPAIVLVVITVIHHISSAFATTERMRQPSFKLVKWGDIFLTALETTSYIAIIGMLEGSSYGRYFLPRFALLGVVGLWILTLSISSLLPVKVTCLTDPKWARKDPQKATLNLEDKTCLPAWLEHFKYPAGELFGRKMWRTNVPGEPASLSFLRGFLALVSVCAIVAYGVYQAIILPISEMGMVPVRAYRAPGLDRDYVTAIVNSDVEYKVLLLWYRHSNITTRFADAVTATARFRAVDGSRLVEAVDCRIDPVSFTTSLGYGTPGAVVVCPPSPNQQLPGRDPNYADPWWDFPNFDIRVNFTGILDPRGAMADRVSDAVRAYLGFTKDLNRVYFGTEAVSLFPGTNMLSVANLVLRQRLNQASLATLGFESQETYLVASIAQTFTNPYVRVEGDPNIGTLAFTIQNLINEWMLVQDYRSKSVLSGLSALGGLSSLMSTLLVLVLGKTLGQTLIRSKANSSFGFLHGLTSERIRATCNQCYPKLEDDIKTHNDHGGLVKYILDTFIDLETLGYEPKMQSTPLAPAALAETSSRGGARSRDLEN